ncbi:MAG TPA: STAS domain-containing protein [Acidimicrobiales bacterium]|jgi:anti-sigma B factor antagonist|nr:STAS domain-containing protein [Acidimicrobiales bacterium]
MSQAFHTDVARSSDELLVRVSGELDITVRTALVDDVGAALQEEPPPRLVLDLGGVTFCDSSGLGALLDIRRLADEAGVAVVLRAVSAQVARLLDLTDVDGWLTRE